jgi:hypothetical protein
MSDLAKDPAVLEQLRAQRSRLADRLRPPWWYLAGAAALWAVVFASPFSSRYLPATFPVWPVLIDAVLVGFLLQRGLVRVTGISIGLPDLTYRPGRPARVAMLLVALAGVVVEHLLIGRGLVAAAVVVAVLGVVAGVVSVRAALHGVREDLRTGA